MKKYRASKVLTVILLIGVLVTPYLYDRLHSVDPFEAAHLAQLPTEDIGPTLAHCMNSKSPRAWLPRYPRYDRNEARPDFGNALSADYYYLSGRLGWHITWAMLVPINAKPITAYETFGAMGGHAGALFRQEVPWDVVSRLKQCGAEYGGVWPTEMPNL